MYLMQTVLSTIFTPRDFLLSNLLNYQAVFIFLKHVNEREGFADIETLVKVFPSLNEFLR